LTSPNHQRRSEPEFSDVPQVAVDERYETQYPKAKSSIEKIEREVVQERPKTEKAAHERKIDKETEMDIVNNQSRPLLHT
jgi:hypothetical protein